MSRLLFEARAAVLACEAQQRLVEKEIELEKLKQQRKPLTDAEIGIVSADIWGSVLIAPQSYQAFARAIEAAHGIKGDA